MHMKTTLEDLRLFEIPLRPSFILAQFTKTLIKARVHNREESI